MAETSPFLMKNSANARENAKREQQERKRNILCLIVDYLRDWNFHDTADLLENETQLTNQYEVCDNIDLDLILQEYQSYYFAKFQKSPKIIKKVNECDRQTTKKTQKRQAKNCKYVEKTRTSPASEPDDFKFEIISLSDNKSKSDSAEKPACKPLCDFEGYTGDWKEIAEQITKEIVSTNLNVRWCDCIGLNQTIEALKEATIYPSLYPELFNGLLRPWRGILLYGPPGTGKTLLAKALTYESDATFVNVTSSTFISKWRGESEKMIKVLFDVAKLNAPTIVFIDELDAFVAGVNEWQHEASRRFKSELLIQLDGILRTDDQVFLLATTNSPWKLDAAVLRRFEKRILVDLPTEEARYDLFKYFLEKNNYQFLNHELKCMSEKTVNFSGSDIKLVCKEIAMSVIREKLVDIKDTKKKFKLRQVNLTDCISAIEKVKPTTDCNHVQKYYEWHKKFGCL